jgi:glucose/arabinose dehydrogenase
MDAFDRAGWPGVYDGRCFLSGAATCWSRHSRNVRCAACCATGGGSWVNNCLLADLNERMRDVKVAPDGSIYVLTDGIDAKLLRLTLPSRNG